MKRAILSVLFTLLPLHSAVAGFIDFGSADWSGADGVTSFTNSGITLTATEDIWFVGVKLSQSVPEGIGVNRNPCLCADENDEIDDWEILKIDLGSPQFVTSVLLSRFFTNDDHHYQGDYRLDLSGSWSYFSPSSAGGTYTLPIGQTVQFIELGYRGSYSDILGSKSSEYSVKGIDIAAVPEPGSLMLIALGFLGLGFSRRQAKARFAALTS